MMAGIHTLLFTRFPEEARAFFRDVLAYLSVDSGEGWLVFRLPSLACPRRTLPGADETLTLYQPHHPAAIDLPIPR